MEKQDLISMLESIDVDIDNAYNIYQYGSRVYETDTEKSDYDFIVVADNKEPITGHYGSNISCNLYNIDHFIHMANEHEISVLECLFLPDRLVIKKELPIEINISLPALRKSISTKSSHSFVKAKKKLTVKKDYDEYVALKSLFHSLRIIKFGIQIAKYGKIIDYTAANHYFVEIFTHRRIDWEYLKSIYKPIFNELMTEFRLLAPKEI